MARRSWVRFLAGEGLFCVVLTCFAQYFLGFLALDSPITKRCILGLFHWQCNGSALYSGCPVAPQGWITWRPVCKFKCINLRRIVSDYSDSSYSYETCASNVSNVSHCLKAAPCPVSTVAQSCWTRCAVLFRERRFQVWIQISNLTYFSDTFFKAWHRRREIFSPLV